MTLANTVVGGILKKNNIKSIFRNHEKPPQDKTKELDQIISEYKLEHSGNFHLQKDFNKIIKIIRNKKLSFLNDFLLRSQSKALYSSENKGHFGLSLNYYVHFTSPIRRYSDLIVHRDLINFYFYKKKKSNEDFTEHLNIQEKKAQSIERSIFEMASCFFLKRYKNYEFKGFIDSIESFGLFIKAINFPFSGLARNTFEHNHFKFSKKKNQKFRLGQLVKFKIKRINERNGKILLHNVKELPNE